MSTALELQIEETLRGKLEGICVADGYYTDLGDNVFDLPQSADEVDDTKWPFTYLLPGEELSAEGCNGGRYGSWFEFWVVVFAKGPLDELLPLLLELKADVKKAVLTDSSLGLGAGVVNDTEWGGARRAVDVVEHTGRGRVALRFLVGADWSPSAA